MKVFLEFDVENMLYYLSFDRKSVAAILDSEEAVNRKSLYPLIFMSKHNHTGIDTSLKLNQIRSTQKMMEYVILKQNKECYAHLFQHNMIDIMLRGIPVVDMFNSNIFNYQFSYVEWPNLSLNDEKTFTHYNGSWIKLRYEFKNIFPDHLEDLSLDTENIEAGGPKLFKINYQCNLLISSDQTLAKLTDVIADTEELAIFETDLIIDTIDFKWNKFAKRVHQTLFFFHICYIVACAKYIRKAYLIDAPVADVDLMLHLMMVFLFSPMIYDSMQLVKQGPKKYLRDFWNYVDMTNIWGGFINIYMQWHYRDHPAVVCLFVVIILITLFKLFFFFRINPEFSIITVMIFKCVYDLRIFMTFFVVLLMFFGMAFNILSKNLQTEYKHLGKVLPGFINALMVSVGNFDYT